MSQQHTFFDYLKLNFVVKVIFALIAVNKDLK